jgi:hypothetical protein
MNPVGPEPEQVLRGFEARAHAFLRFIADHADNPETTIWGPYRLFDGYALALLALGDDLSRARPLIEETLANIESDMAQERRDPEWKWHLSDFALQALLRIWFLFHDKVFCAPGDSLWIRVATTAQHYRYHYGDLTENHNLLHLALRYLVAQAWPDAMFADGRTARAHLAEAATGLSRWMQTWVERGSAEWGSEIYYNVLLLALLNLHDFGDAAPVRQMAKSVLDFLLLDMASDAFAGASVGASRRSYAAYRLDTGESPSRAVHCLYFAAEETPSFNLNFIGGVLAAATSSYRPDAVTVSIAMDRRCSAVTHTTHTVGCWSRAGHLSRTTFRTPDVMLSTMNSPGGLGRYTEQVCQITLSSQAVVSANHPCLRDGALSPPPGSPAQILEAYEAARQDPRHRFWGVGNVPPGHKGDIRPGFWQGNGWGPRSYGEGCLAFLVYSIPADDPLPWPHVFVPRFAFDEVVERDAWLFGRRGNGYVGIWLPSGYEWTRQGVWADCEARLRSGRAAILFVVGRGASHGTFADFERFTATLQARWDSHSLTLSARSPEDGALISVNYRKGAYRDHAPARTKFGRIETPWGSMPLGARNLILQKDGRSCSIILPPIPHRHDLETSPARLARHVSEMPTRWRMTAHRLRLWTRERINDFL